MKPKTIAQIYAAREILRLHLENLPTVLELAQQVGLSVRTLHNGFQFLFATTIFNYLTEQRMILAVQQLREISQSLLEVANLVGYVNPAKFAVAFKRKFGIMPSECAQGKKIDRIALLELKPLLKLL